MTFHDRFKEMKANRDFTGLADSLPYTKFMGIHKNSYEHHRNPKEFNS